LIGHVRAGTSGHWGIPNPHPFEHDGILFAHNGVISEEMLTDLLTQDDPSCLETYPPDYVNGHIDSELYFLYIPEGDPGAGREDRAPRDHPGGPGDRGDRSGDSAFNFVMTAGDTLYALRCSAYDSGDAVRFYPANVPNSCFWIPPRP